MRLLSQGSKVSRRLRSHTRETGTEHFENGTGEERMEVVLDREKLRSVTSRLGLLVGLSTTGDSKASSFVVLVGHCACIPSSSPLTSLEALGLPTADWSASVQFASCHFPAGCGGTPCGLYVRVEEGEGEGEGEGCPSDRVRTVMELICKHSDFLAVMRLSSSTVLSQILVVSMGATAGAIECYTLDASGCDCRADWSGDLQPCAISKTTPTSYLTTSTRMLQVQVNFDLLVSTDKGGPCSQTMPDLTRQLQSPSLVLLLPSLQRLLRARSDATEHSTLDSVLKKGPLFPTPVPVEVLLDTSPSNQATPTAPTLSLSPVVGEVARVSLPLDMVGVFPLSSPVADVVAAVKASLVSQLKEMERAIFWKEGTVCSVRVAHFPLPNQLCPVTVVSPHIPLGRGEGEGLSDAELLPHRKELHRRFNLPTGRPYLRTTNRKYFDVYADNLLVNPHTSLKQTRDTQGMIAMVTGSYSYHHYMQDKFNDDGWGCAYRSLQTLWSWFVLQGYTRQPVPSHRQIQSALVEAGDKESAFVGSRQWIGSFEVSTCLNHLLGIESRIHHCTSGAEMSGVGRVLLGHFRTQGTPVMIGGGVLAHTILGVDWSEVTGEIRFLILDPHYTGREDVKTVTDKGWCGWKPVTFWNQQAHYNMCMPLCPNEM